MDATISGEVHGGGGAVSSGAASERLSSQVSRMFVEFTEQVCVDDRHGVVDPGGVLETVTRVARRRVGGVAAASITTHDGNGFTTAASTEELARAADVLQYSQRAGPVIHMIETGVTSQLGTADQQRRWPDLERRLAAECGIFSVLSVPMGHARVNGDKSLRAGLNLYAVTADAFGPTGTLMATVLAFCAGQAWAAANAAARTEHLERALNTTQQIGAAIGLLMGRHALTHDQANDLLRTTSQRTHQKVSELAAHLLESGELPLPPANRSRPRRTN